MGDEVTKTISIRMQALVICLLVEFLMCVKSIDINVTVKDICESITD